MRAAAIALWVVGIGLALWLATTVAGAPDRAAADPQPPDHPGPAGDAVSDAQPRRRQVDAGGDLGAARRPSFDDHVERLVELGVRMWDLVENGEPDAARELDVEARAVLRELHNRTPAPGEKAVHRLCGLMSEDTTIRGRVRRKVLLRILGDALKSRWNRALHGGSRTPANQLVESMLRVIPQDEVLARDLGAGLLVGEPYLDAVHEPAVLDLVEAVPEQPHLMPVASALLLTLWENLGESGARSAGSLASLALLFKDDKNPSRRTAALEFLLGAEDGRYRDVVLEQVVARGDPGLAREVAQTAATELPPEEAMPVLARLADVADGGLMAAFMLLGTRDPDLLAAAYESRLADGVTPQLRADLITGAGFGGPQHLGVAQLAFDHDPDPEVRARAMFILTSHAPPDQAERTLMAVLDDPRNAADPRWVGRVVSAMRNLAASGAVNELARVGARLRVHPSLGPRDREQLEALLAEHLPGGK